MINHVTTNKNIGLTVITAPAGGGKTTALMAIANTHSRNRKVVLFEGEGACLELASIQSSHNIAVFTEPFIKLEDTKRIITLALKEHGNVSFVIDDIDHVCQLDVNEFPARGPLKFLNFLNELDTGGQYIHVAISVPIR